MWLVSKNMSNAKMDENNRPTIICVSNVDGITIVPIKANKVNHGVVTDDNTTGSDNGNNDGNAMIDENGVSVFTALSDDGSGEIVEIYSDPSTGAILTDSS